MSRLRFSEVSAGSVLTPPSGKATVFLDSADNLLKAKLDDGSLIVLTVTQEYLDDLVANLLQDSVTIDFTYDDLGNSLKAEVIQSALNIALIPNVPSGNLTAVNVQDALNELQSSIDTSDSDLTAHINDVTDAHDASAISNIPSGNLTATDVQSALNELQSDIDTRALQSSLTAHENLTSGVHGVTGTVVGTTDTQTLTNKTIDADDNTILDLEVDNLKAGVLNTSTTLTGASNTQIPSALAVKTYVDNAAAAQNEASEISYDNVISGLSATNVQDAIDEVEFRVETVETGLANHLADTVDAHDASAISNIPSGNLVATDVQSALNELQTDVDTRATLVELNNHINDTSDAHDASAISVIPTGNLNSTEVQAALVELQTDIDNISAGAVELAQDAVGSILLDSAEIDFTYDDVTPSITADLKNTTVTAGTYGTSTQVSTVTVDAKGRLTSASNTTIAIPSTQVTDFTEASQDAAAIMLTSATHDGVSVTYNDAGNSLSITNTDKGSVAVAAHEAAVDPHPQYTTTAEASAAAPVQSVNSQTGNVVLTTTDIAEGTNLYFTNERAQDAVGNIFTDSSSVDFTYDDAGNTVSATVLPAGVNHNLLQNYVANQHVDHSTVAINPGTGLSGGGDITATRTLNIANTTVTPGSYGSATQVSSITVNAQGQLTSASNTSIAIPSTQVTDFTEAAQDAVGNILTDSATVDFTYNDVANTISAIVVDGSITDVKVATGINATKIGTGTVDNTEFGYLNGVTSDIQTQLNNKQPLDGDLTAIAALAGAGFAVRTTTNTWATRSIIAGAGIGVADSDGVFANPTISNADRGSTAVATHVADADPHPQYTTAAEASAAAPVQSVNSQTGAVVLTTTNISEGTNLYFTDERAQDAVGSILTDSATIDFTYNDPSNTISAIIIDGSITSAKIGDAQVTSLKIADDAIVTNRILSNSVTNPKLADMGANTLKGNNTGAVGDPLDLTVAQVRTMLSINNVDNTSDLNKPISTSTQTALDGKANLVGNNSFTGGTQTLTPTLATDTALAATQGRVLIGSATPQDITGLGVFPPFQIQGTSATQMAAIQYSNDINPPAFNLLKSRGATVGTQGLVAADDDIGRLQFRGSDGVNFQAAASVRGIVDGTPSAGSMPGRLAFLTTPTGSITPLERMRINQAGEVTVGGVLGSTLTNNLLSINGTANSYFQSNVQNLSNGTSASGDMVVTADNGTDTTNYIDVGINNSGYADPTFTINGPNDGYVYINGGDLSIGTATANKIVFFTGDTLAANEVARITPTGQFSVGATAPNAASKLQIDSTTQGFLMPRMTSTQRLAITTPPAGLSVYDTTLNTICTYTGSTWAFEINYNTTAVQTTTSNVYANVTEWVTASLEPGLYALRLRGIAQSTALNTGIGLKLLNGSSTITEVNINWSFNQAAAGTDKDFEYNQIALGDNVTSASVITANANFAVHGDGVFRVSVAGTVAIQIRSEVNASGVSIRPNSTLILKRVGV